MQISDGPFTCLGINTARINLPGGERASRKEEMDLCRVKLHVGLDKSQYHHAI